MEFGTGCHFPLEQVHPDSHYQVAVFIGEKVEEKTECYPGVGA